MDDKTCTVRLSANGRLEFKLPDSAVNPYLSHTVLLAAIGEGLRHGIDAGPPLNAERPASEPAEQRFPGLPMTLGEAVSAFQEDKVVHGALPADLGDTYLALKSDEWARFCGAVTDWEHNRYSEVLS